MEKLKIKRNIIQNPYFILLLIIGFHLCNNIIVLRLDNTPLVYDAGEYYSIAKDFFYNGIINRFRPPLIFSLSLPLFKLFGISQKVAILGIGSFSLLVVLLTTYLLAKELYSKEVGLLSAFILSCCPIIFGHSRSFMSDLLLTGWVTFSILLMVQPGGFVSLKYIIPLGIVMGLGMLTKIVYPLYIFTPLVYLLFKQNLNRKIYLNLLLIFAISFSLCSFWYLPNAFRVSHTYINMGQFPFIRISEIIPEVFQYIFDTFKYGISIIALPFFIIIFLKKNKINQSNLFLLLIWITIPYSILSIFDVKNLRYVIPFLPAIIIIYSSLVYNLKSASFKQILITAIVFLSIFQTLFISYSPLAGKIYEPASSYNEWQYQLLGLFRPWREDWKIKETYNTIERARPGIKKKIIFIKTRPIITTGLNEIREEGTFEIILSHFELCCLNTRREEFSNSNFLLSKLNEADIVIKVEDSIMDGCENDDKLDELFTKNIDKFNLINAISLSDDSQIKIYKRLN